jgi:hypothetical protein
MFAIRTGDADQKKLAHPVTSNVRPIASEQWPLIVRAWTFFGNSVFRDSMQVAGGDPNWRACMEKLGEKRMIARLSFSPI